MERVYSVGQVNTYIKRLLSADYALSRIAIKGEISNCKYHSSGHIYFTLKDEKGAMRCVMFASSRTRGLSFTLQDGQSVVVHGRIDVFERDGSYQLYANKITLDGAGALYERYEQLKQKLNEEGLFDFEHKKPIPKYVKTIGIVTAPTGAAIQDIMSIAKRRNPYVQLYLYPAKVQGEGAKEAIVKGIKRLDAMQLDVIIVGRGGGSIEDLWAFNEESVARAIYEAKTPIISGTGHETDTTIADYVADKRAATPSAACELAIFEYDIYIRQLLSYQQRLRHGMLRLLGDRKQQLENCQLRIERMNPKFQLEQQRQQLDEYFNCMLQLVQEKYKIYQDNLVKKKQKLYEQMPQKLLKYKHVLELKTVKLHGLSPTSKLINGYGYIAKDGKPVKDITRIKKDSVVEITMAKGSKKAQII